VNRRLARGVEDLDFFIGDEAMEVKGYAVKVSHLLLERTQVKQRRPGLPDFFLVQDTKTRKKPTKNIPNVLKIFQMAIKYINIFPFKALQNLPNFFSPKIVKNRRKL
jgi:hypothetical protein